MKIYDMHIHAEGGAPNPSDLIEKMEKAGIYGGAIISVRPEESYGKTKMNYEERMKNVLGWTKGYEDRLFPVLWIHPREENLDEKIRDAASRGISAFKMICDDYYVYDDVSMKAIEDIAKTGKPVLDMSADDYDFKYAQSVIEMDNKIYDKLGVTEEIENLIYSDNFLRFMGVKESNHTRRSSWRISDGI